MTNHLGHVILSEAKDLRQRTGRSSPPGILRFTQDDMSEMVCHGLHATQDDMSEMVCHGLHAMRQDSQRRVGQIGKEVG